MENCTRNINTIKNVLVMLNYYKQICTSKQIEEILNNQEICFRLLIILNINNIEKKHILLIYLVSLLQNTIIDEK